MKCPTCATVDLVMSERQGIHHGRGHHHDDHGYGKHGKRSFLKDLFD